MGQSNDKPPALQIKKPYCKNVQINIFGSKAIFLYAVKTSFKTTKVYPIV